MPSVAGDEGLRRKTQKGVSGSEERGTVSVGARVGVRGARGASRDPFGGVCGGQSPSGQGDPVQKTGHMG